VVKKTTQQKIEEVKAEITQLEAEMPAVQEAAKQKSQEYGLNLFDTALEIAEEIQGQNKVS
jgi:phosphoribosylaminoimidazole-succinocarboxamide synthase